MDPNAFSSSAATGGIFAAMGILWVVYLALIVFMIVCYWKIFVKAGKPGWASLIPIYNLIVILEIVNRPVWWLAIMLLVPFVNVIFMIIMVLDLAKAFGKSGAWGFFMLIILGIIGLPMLAFGGATYTKPERAA